LLAGTQIARGLSAGAVETLCATCGAVIGTAVVTLRADLAAQVADVCRDIVVTQDLAVRAIDALGVAAGLADLDQRHAVAGGAPVTSAAGNTNANVAEGWQTALADRGQQLANALSGLVCVPLYDFDLTG